ncbi:MAG: hypothetical protein NVSMB65_14390 [Chloroflexota bacterium]
MIEHKDSTHADADWPMHTAEPVISVVAPVFNEAETLPHFYARTRDVLDSLGEPWELILCDDGSRDASPAIERDLCAGDARVRAVQLSRNFGHQVVISAGMDYARGRAIVIIDSDLQDPPEVIRDLVARWREGYEVIYAQRETRQGESAFKLLTARMFYRVIRRLTAVNIPPDTGDFRLLDRKVVDVLTRMPEHHRFMRGLSIWVGFRQIGVTYARHERFAGSTKYPLKKMLRFAWDGVTSFSYVPLQLATSCGFLVAGLSLLGILLAEIDAIRPHDSQQFGHHRGNAAEVVGAASSLQAAGDLPHVDGGLGRYRVHFLDGGEKDHVCLFRVQQSEVPCFVTRVAGEILTGRELCGIDEDSHHRHIILGASTPHEAQMSFVEIAHRRHKTDRAALASLLIQDAPDRLHCVSALHDRFPAPFRRCRSPCRVPCLRLLAVPADDVLG